MLGKKDKDDTVKTEKPPRKLGEADVNHNIKITIDPETRETIDAIVANGVGALLLCGVSMYIGHRVTASHYRRVVSTERAKAYQVGRTNQLYSLMRNK